MDFLYIGGMVLLFFIGFMFGYRQYYVKVKEDLALLTKYKKNYLKKTGAAYYNNRKIDYRLVSLNGGSSWYVTDKSGEIYGNVEDIYPQLTDILDVKFPQMEKEEPELQKRNIS